MHVVCLFLTVGREQRIFSLVYNNSFWPPPHTYKNRKAIYGFVGENKIW